MTPQTTELTHPQADGLRGLDSPEAAALVCAGQPFPASLRAAAARAEILLMQVIATDRVQPTDQLDGPGAVTISHTGPSPFFASDIDLVLRSNGIRTLYVCGDPVAGLRLAYDAQRKGYRAVLVRSGNAPTEAIGLRLPHISQPELTGQLAGTAPGPRNWHEAVKAERMARPFADRLAPSRTALIMIDVLNDFCAEDGVIGKTKAAMPRVTEALPRIRALLEGARAAGAHVLHVQAIYGPMFRGQGSPYRYPSDATREGAVWCASAADITGAAPAFDPSMTEVCREGTWGADFVAGMGPVAGETVIRKHRYSAYLDTALDAELRRRGIETVVLAGVTTNCCVESTARDLAMSDYDTVIAEDCVAVKDLVMHLHDASIEQIRTYFGIVTPSDRILDAWH